MLELSDRKWAEFKVGDLMTLKVAKSNDKGNLEVGTVPFVGRSNDNNGLQGFYDAPNVTQGKCITLGMVGTFRAFWQENDFAASQNILTLRAPWLNRHTALFICNIIETAIKGRYSYGNSIKAGTFGDTILNLPVDDNGQPDYDFMEQYIVEREPDYSWATGCIESDAEISLSDKDWAEFKVKDIFPVVSRGKRLTKANRVPGNTPLITAGFLNYGVGEYISNPSQTRYEKAITIDMFGNAFYRGTEFCCDDNIIVLQNPSINEWAKMFITPIIDMRKNQYSYGNQYRLGDLETHIISLPITAEGKPDYDFMERYMKSLPFSKVLE